MNGVSAHGNGEREYQRFTRLNRVLHIIMIVSFITLSVTGLSLKFSHTLVARVVSAIFGGFESAGYVHRVAATMMIGIFLAHLVDLVRIKRADRLTWLKLVFGPGSMMFNRKDWDDLRGNLLWFLGRGTRPAYTRWSYWEKFDYFGVFWGTAIIGSTGFLLWFPEFFTHLLPGWWINVATIVHSYEALLAVGFIFTVHFFNTHLRPGKFPMDIVIFTGRMPVEELKHDKPAEYDALVASGTLEKNLVDPYPPIVIRAVRFFAGTALVLGVAVVLWILYAYVTLLI